MTRLPDLPTGCRLIAYETIDSTSDEAKRLAAAGASDQTYIWAREQTAGRGRRGNRWISPEGNLYLSVVLRPTSSVAVAAQLSFVSALALADAIEACAGVKVALKWPNDLLIDDCKVAGILVESAAGAGGTVDWVVIGTGVNVAPHPTELPRTTSLNTLGFEVDLADLIEAYAEGLRARTTRWSYGGFADTRRAWLARAAGIGQPIRVRLPDREEVGIFEDLDETGALVLAQESGRLIIASGDVFPAEAR